MVLAGALAIGCVGISNGLSLTATAEETEAQSTDLQSERSDFDAAPGIATPLETNPLTISSCNYYTETDSSGEEKYITLDCMVKYTWKTSSNYSLYLSNDGLRFTQQTSTTVVEFASPAIGSNITSATYQYGYVTNKTTGATYSAIQYSPQAVPISIVNYSNGGEVIDTSWDQSGNVWTHGGKSGQTIRGTIAYNGEAKNIQVEIPLLSTHKSEIVTVGGVEFQLRCGPSKVSIKASKSITCNTTSNYFAFGISD